MVKKNKALRLKKSLSQILTCLGLIAALGTSLQSNNAFAQAPAPSGMPTSDVVADYETAATAVSSAASAASNAITAFNAAIAPFQQAWAKAIDGINNSLQAQISAMNVDTASNNNRMNVNVQAAHDITLQNDLPTGPLAYSSCRVAQAAAAGADLDAATGAVAQAMASGGSPLDTPAMAAQNIKNGLDFGLDPCTNDKDTEYNVNKSLKCTPKWNGAFERADRTLTALYSSFQFPVPPSYTGPVNGVYQPLDASKITSAKYMPFVAAYSACQHLQPTLPPAPPAVTSNPTVAALAKDKYKRAELKASAAVSECMSQLSERMQYGNQMTGHFKDLFTDQATICTADIKLGYLASDPQYTFADGSTGACSTDGRSAVQRRQDVSEREQQSSYQAVYLAGADRHDILAENRSLQIEKQNFSAYIAGERAALNAAIQASEAAETVYTSTLDMPVTK